MPEWPGKLPRSLGGSVAIISEWLVSAHDQWMASTKPSPRGRPPLLSQVSSGTSRFEARQLCAGYILLAES